MDLKRWRNCIIFILFSISGIVLSQNKCVPGIDFPGYTVPNGDITLEYGEPLDIMCVLYNSSEQKFGPNASQYLKFQRNSEMIPSEMIKIVNSSAISLHIDKPAKTTSDSYTCLMEKNGTSVNSVCMNFVTVGIKPQTVTDFDCIGYNYDNLTCTWTPPENYVKTEYNLTFTFGNRAARNEILSRCPMINTEPDGRMSCFWNVSTTPPYRMVHSEFYFNLTMKNKFGTNHIEVNFKHFAHVLSGPPENLTGISISPSTIQLYWMVPTSMQTFEPGLHHRILYQCEYDEKKWHFGGLITKASQKLSEYITYNLTNLKHAHAICDIRVSLRSAAAFKNDESMWSRNASTTVRTRSKIPDEPPKTDVGSFEIVAFGNSLQNREAYIYWQQIPDDQKNGPDFHYVINVEGNDSIQAVDITNTYAKFKDLSISTSYKFNIWSKNANGTSLRKSTVFIPKQTDRVNEPLSFTKVEFGDGKYELTWEPPKLLPNQVITNYTIFWCSNERDRPYQCNGKLDWKVVPGDKTVHSGIVAQNKIFQFAISANTHNSSSGMLWAACTVIHNKHMGKMKNVWINKLGPTFIQVGWKLDCSDRIGTVEGYIIYYCPIKSPIQTECKDPQKNVTFPGGNTAGGNITKLKPYTTYMLTVAVITKHTTYSQQSDPLFNTTLEAAPSSPRNLTIVDVTNSSISLTWLPPKDKNGILKYYEIQYNQIPVIVDYDTSLTLTNLTSYENYSISIRACTVECSKKSETINVTTKMGYPSKIQKPTVDRRNDSSITIIWHKPSQPAGKNDYYEVQFKQQHRSKNTTVLVNVTDQKYVIENCGDGGKFNAFYLSVRAVNIINNHLYKGAWSDELENYCDTPYNYLIYILISAVAIAFFVAMGFLFNRLYKHCKIMSDVEVKLPPGLVPVEADHTLVIPWNTEKHLENRDSHSPADEELLLVKMSEGRHLSGDSSGCSSGHESVTSSLESGTHISSSSDSGTEQPGNYCVLGVDPKADSSYVLVATDTNKVPYKTCDVSNDSSPYVMTGDVVKTINPGYIPFNQTEPIGKTSGYVVAGLKNCNGYIPFNQTETVNSVVAGIKNCKLD